MKLDFKKVLAGALVAASCVPVFAFAQDQAVPAATATPTTQAPQKATGFCANVATLSAKLAAQITKTETNQSAYQSKRAGVVAQKESDIDAKRASGRTTEDEKRLSNWDKMTTKAKTDSQKAAIAAYKTAISTAVTTRRSAVDAAVKAYRDGLTSAMTAHSTAIDTAMTTFKASIDAALSKAQADCTAGVANKTVQTAFNASIKDARTALAAARKNAEMASGLTALKNTRNDAIKAAEAAFKKAADQAHADLIVALKK